MGELVISAGRAVLVWGIQLSFIPLMIWFERKQIAMMQNAAETDPTQSRKHRRKLSMFKHVLAEHPYSHRPYYRQSVVEERSAPGVAASSSALSAWDNEGGVC